MKGHVWDNFSSDTYKNFTCGRPPIEVQHPLTGATFIHPPGGGPGYTRVASLVATWASAPYLQ